MARKRSFKRPKEQRQFVRNFSSRNGAKIKLIVIHTTESHNRPGTSDVEAIRTWFDNPASQASSHVTIDAAGHAITMVRDHDKAWTQASYNPVSLSIELVGWAATPRWRWLKRLKQLNKAAQYVAYWSRIYDIPIDRLGSVMSGEVIRPGVIGHMHLGTPGGGHHDPGPGFPFEVLLRKARWYRRNGWYR